MVISRWSGLRRWVMAATLLSLLALAGASPAQVSNTIYRDTFNRTGMLNDSTPNPVDRGGATWIAGQQLITDGSEMSVTNADPGGVKINNAFLPFTPQAGHVYTLSIDLKGTYGGNRWLAFGFAQNALMMHHNYAAGSIGAGWLLQRANNSQIQFFRGPGRKGSAKFPADRNTKIFNRYGIALDTTTGDASHGWTITFYRNGNQIAQEVYSSNPAIRYVGIGAGGANGYFRDFRLSECTPAKYRASGYRNVAFWREPGVQVKVSSHSFRVGAMKEPGNVCPLNRPFVPGEPESRCWITSMYQHLPQWAWFHFGGLRRIDKVVLYAGSMATKPVEFSGQYLPNDSNKFHMIFHVQQARFDPKSLSYTIRFKPVVTSNFRLLIERNAAPGTPQSWVADLAQVKIYGDNATNKARICAVAPSKIHVTTLNSDLHPTKFVPQVRDMGHSLAISTRWYRLVLDKAHPRIQFLSWDSIGKSELSVNFLHKSGAGPVLDPIFHKAIPLGVSKLTRTSNVFHYAPVELATGTYEQVSIRANERGFDLGLVAEANHTVMMRGGLFRFHFAANQTPTTFVCHPSKIMNYVETPAYLAAPDFGTVYVTRTGDPAAFYRIPDKLFIAKTYWVDITPHRPTTEDGLNEIGPKPWHTTLHFAVKHVEPLPALIDKDPRLKRFCKYSLNMVQWRPDTEILGNSVMSVDCGLAILFYAQEALFAPHLRDGISPMALVRTSVERYFQGAPGYMMPDRNVCAPDWRSSRETPAYLVIAAWYVIRTIGGTEQLHKWLKPLECLANHLQENFGSDGLVYYPDTGRGSMWFDTYKFRGADAYSNAADYRAFRCMTDLEALAGRRDLAKRYREDADRIKAAYFKSFYNPKTGVLAGWRTKEGTLHDYMFPWVNGFAICQGLVPPEAAKAILQVLLAKLNEIGFHSYQLGLPTNLLPLSPDDYFPHTSGAPKQADGLDTWQIYMNGGATPAFEYYVIQALYQTGQYREAERLLWPLMQSYEKGTFNCGVGVRGQKQRNPVGSAFYEWDGSRGRGEGYLPEDWDGIEALFTGHYGIGFNRNGYYLEPWSPLKGQKVKLDLPYMGKTVEYINTVSDTSSVQLGTQPADYALSRRTIRGPKLQRMVLSRCEHIAFWNRPYQYNGIGDCYGYCRQVWNAILADGKEHTEDYDPNRYNKKRWINVKGGIPVNTFPDTHWVYFSSSKDLVPGDLLATDQGHFWGPRWHGGIYAGNGEDWDCSKQDGLNGAYKRPLFSGFRFYYKPLHELLLGNSADQL